MKHFLLLSFLCCWGCEPILEPSNPPQPAKAVVPAPKTQASPKPPKKSVDLWVRLAIIDIPVEKLQTPKEMDDAKTSLLRWMSGSPFLGALSAQCSDATLASIVQLRATPDEEATVDTRARIPVVTSERRTNQGDLLQTISYHAVGTAMTLKADPPVNSWVKISMQLKQVGIEAPKPSAPNGPLRHQAHRTFVVKNTMECPLGKPVLLAENTMESHWQESSKPITHETPVTRNHRFYLLRVEPLP